MRLYYETTARLCRSTWKKRGELKEKNKDGARQAAEELAAMRMKLEEAEEKIEEAERETRAEIKEMKKEREMLLEKANWESGDSRAVIKKRKGEVGRLRRIYNERENERGEKLQGELGKRRELLRASESKFEALVKQREGGDNSRGSEEDRGGGSETEVCGEGEGNGGSASNAHGGYEESGGGGGLRDERDKPNILRNHHEGHRLKHGEKNLCASSGVNTSGGGGGERDKEREGEGGLGEG